MVQCRLGARLAHQGIDRLEVDFRLLLRNGRELSSRLARGWPGESCHARQWRGIS
jgi:hypothetical protein